MTVIEIWVKLKIVQKFFFWCIWWNPRNNVVMMSYINMTIDLIFLWVVAMDRTMTKTRKWQNAMTITIYIYSSRTTIIILVCYVAKYHPQNKIILLNRFDLIIFVRMILYDVFSVHLKSINHKWVSVVSLLIDLLN